MPNTEQLLYKTDKSRRGLPSGLQLYQKRLQHRYYPAKWLQLHSKPEPLSSQTSTQPFDQTGWVLTDPNGWVFVSELNGSGFESSCSRLNFWFRACFEQGVPWDSGNCRVWIHSELRTWHDKNVQSILL